MATAGRRSPARLSDVLFREAHRFGFFQAVRLLHHFAPRRPGVGRSGPPPAEPVRFVAEPSLAFPASEIRELDQGVDEPRPVMMVRFMGLFGPQGTLPRHYTDLVIDRLRRKDGTLAAFLDLLNHRLVSLFYRVWEKYHPHLRVRPDVEDDLSVALLSLFGLGTRGLRRRLAVPDRALIFYTGLLAQRPRSATGLTALLHDYFNGLGVDVTQFVGQWMRLDPDCQTCLLPLGGNTQLGVDTILGERVWNTQAKFAVRLGPMTYSQMCDFLPGGAASREALDLTRFYAGLDFDFEFRLVLQANEVRTTELGSTGPEATRLGWSTWLTSRPATKDADDAVFTSESLIAHARATTAKEAA